MMRMMKMMMMVIEQAMEVEVESVVLPTSKPINSNICVWKICNTSSNSLNNAPDHKVRKTTKYYLLWHRHISVWCQTSFVRGEVHTCWVMNICGGRPGRVCIHRHRGCIWRRCSMVLHLMCIRVFQVMLRGVRGILSRCYDDSIVLDCSIIHEICTVFHVHKDTYPMFQILALCHLLRQSLFV